MTIKSDKWIRRMAEQTGMIEPFEPGQVREANGHKIVSYGTSSYGYDIRCADEFKIFTNINIKHAYSGKYTIGNFTRNLKYDPSQQALIGKDLIPRSASHASNGPGIEPLNRLDSSNRL
jgi:deoxycytidine triphosphate deaminase